MFKALKKKVDLMQKVNLKQKVGLKTKVATEIVVLTIGGMLLYGILVIGTLLLSVGTVLTFTNGEVNAIELIENTENSAPKIILNQDYKYAKTTQSFTIQMMASDADGDDLTYTLYYKKIDETEWKNSGSSNGINASTATTLSVTGLGEYTAYDWYIKVTDGTETVESPKQTLRTYCSGDQIILYPNSDKGSDKCQSCSFGTIVCEEGEPVYR